MSNRSEPLFDQPSRDLFPDQLLLDYVSTLVKRAASQGRNLPAEELRWAKDRLGILGKEGGVERDIADLRRDGCKDLPLAVVINCEKFLTRMQDLYDKMFGDITRLARFSEELERPALRSDKGRPEWPFEESVPSPQQMSVHLLRYKLFNDQVRTLFEAMKIHSAPERYAIARYVKDKTGHWHDRQVSALISAATKRTLDEITYRRWRNRYFEQIEAVPFELLWRLAEILQEEQDKND